MTRFEKPRIIPITDVNVGDLVSLTLYPRGTHVCCLVKKEIFDLAQWYGCENMLPGFLFTFITSSGQLHTTFKEVDTDASSASNTVFLIARRC